MKRLVNSQFEHKVEFDDGSSTLIVLESHDIFRSYIADLLNQINGEEGYFVLSDGLKELKLKDNCEIVQNPFCISFYTKKITTKLTERIKQFVLSDSINEEIMKTISRLEEFAIKLENDFFLPIEHEEVGIDSLLKSLGFKVQIDYTNDIERIMEYMNLMHDICGIDCFIFPLLFEYFDYDTIETLVNEANSNKHNILFIENSQPDMIPCNVSKIIVDTDFCEIF